MATGPAWDADKQTPWVHLNRITPEQIGKNATKIVILYMITLYTSLSVYIVYMINTFMYMHIEHSIHPHRYTISYIYIYT